MDENHTEKVAEMIYGFDVTKDHRKYVKQKFNPILNGVDSLYIRDKEQSRYFVEGLCNLINDNNLQDFLCLKIYLLKIPILITS